MSNLIHKNRKGQGLVEYILIVFLIAIVCLGVVKKLGTSTEKGFTKAQTELQKEFGG